LTHGFVVDENGRKMSKSVGNVVAPEKIIKQNGAEILRLWVAAEDYRDDIKISDKILSHLSDAYRKIRNTIRYLLSNLNDFDPATDRVDFAALAEIDQWALSQLEGLRSKIINAYETFEFHVIFQSLQNFCAVTMSAFYLDIQKDRLYTAAPKSLERRAVQTVFYDLVEGILRLMAPVLAFTAAEAWDHLPIDANRETDVALATFPAAHPEHRQPELDKKWERLIAIRRELTRALEIARTAKVIGHSLEAHVTLSVTGELADFLNDNWTTVKNIAIVSELTRADTLSNDAFVSDLPGLSVAVAAAPGEKCERCWTRSLTVGEDGKYPTACNRCVAVLTEMGA